MVSNSFVLILFYSENPLCIPIPIAIGIRDSTLVVNIFSCHENTKTQRTTKKKQLTCKLSSTLY